MVQRIKLGLTLGDPTGIGPELVARLLADRAFPVDADMVVIGDHRHFEQGQEIAGVSVPLPRIRAGDPVRAQGAYPVFLDFPTVEPAAYRLGEVSAKAGRAVLDTLTFALRLAQDGELDALVYAPLNKEAMHRAGSPHEDELRFFAHQLDWKGLHGELNVLDNLWTSRVTSHVALREVPSRITVQRVYEAILLVYQTLREAGVERPKIAVAALNPHGGEGGLFGDEEATTIRPAIARARQEGIGAEGPFPADTIFLRARDGRYDAVVSMYHDQGQVATKLLGFHRGVTVSGGLPVPIATPAHGTAHDIAGQGRANPAALEAAVRIACRMAKGRAGGQRTAG